MHNDRKSWRRMAMLLALPLPALVTYAQAAQPVATPQAAAEPVFTYHKPDVLGTSLDLKIVAPSQAIADACEQTILQEIERLRGILSTYDPQSEISKYQTQPPAPAIAVSSDLHAVLLDYMLWHTASGGAYSAQLGDLIEFWNAAEKKGSLPKHEELAPFLAKLRQNAFLTTLSGNSIHKLTSQRLNIDSLGKGYIVQKAAAVARTRHPAASGILLNIGGDITALGFATQPGVKPAIPWEITVADPEKPAANSTGITTLRLTNKSVATSGAYERFYTFGDKKLSHILNPLTGSPTTNDVLSATVIAPDNATANALATILCVLPQSEGIRLVENTRGASALIVATGGRQIRSKGFASYETHAPGAEVAEKIGDRDDKVDRGDRGDKAAGPERPAAGASWPVGYSLSIDLTILPFKRPGEVPYAAVWVEDTNRHCVRILAAWIGNKKYLP